MSNLDLVSLCLLFGFGFVLVFMMGWWLFTRLMTKVEVALAKTIRKRCEQTVREECEQAIKEECMKECMLECEKKYNGGCCDETD